MSTVSIIIPCYNYAHFLRECVESVVSQAGVEVQVLVIDDESLDNTAEMAAELAAEYPVVQVRRHSKNMGHIATYNEGLFWSSGEYTVLISADDLLTPGALLRATQLMDAHPEVGFVFGGCVWFDSDKPLPQPRLPTEQPEWQIYNGLDWLKSVCETGKDWITSPEVVTRTSLQHQLGGYLPELPHTGDKEMWMRFAAHAAVGQVIDVDQAFYRVHNQNMHTRQFSLAYQDVQQRRAAYDIFFQNYRSIIPGWERYQKMAHRTLASDALWAVFQAFYYRKVAQTPVLELIRFATNSYRGNYFSRDYLGVYIRLFQRIMQSVRKKFKSDIGLASQ
jgi:glycosyltransferase involved in cell wall biosynthesis